MLTAWQGLLGMADLKKGRTVLIHAAAGGVGRLAVQLAKWRDTIGGGQPCGEFDSLAEGDHMNKLQSDQVPMSRTGMLIRKPVAEVFGAIINPEITKKFWFTKSSGHLKVGQPVQWEWEMYGVSISVTAKTIEPNERIVFEWPGADGRTTVECNFSPQKDGTTFVRITEAGFGGNGDAVVRQVADSTEGFTLVLAGLKALLEHNVRLNLVADRYPMGIEEH